MNIKSDTQKYTMGFYLRKQIAHLYDIYIYISIFWPPWNPSLFIDSIEFYWFYTLPPGILLNILNRGLPIFFSRKAQFYFIENTLIHSFRHLKKNSNWQLSFFIDARSLMVMYRVASNLINDTPKFKTFFFQLKSVLYMLRK